jgi:pimeloyl-ACP methyl ester carboxylesterase
LKKELYIFSGLGADESVFQNLDFSAYSTNFIKWIPPIKDEAIENYAARIIQQIKNKKPILIGLSFGGIIAIEIAKLIETEKVILIASAKTKLELPFYYRFAGSFNFHKLLPTQLLKKSNFITYWFFGTQTKFEKALLKNILINTDSQFLKWALDKIVKWENTSLINQVYHIHGSNDKILPIKFIKNMQVIKGGGHLMTLDKFDDLNAILRKQLTKSA